MSTYEFLDAIDKYGKERIIFLIPMTKPYEIMGIHFTDNSAEEKIIPAAIDESKYKVKDNYKVTLCPIYNEYSKEDFYIMDLCELISTGQIKMYIQA